MNPFVYALVDPLEPKHVRYVGMASKHVVRPYDHAKEARRTKTHSHKLHWIRSIQAEGRDPDVLILEELSDGTSPTFLGFVESCYIKSLREIGHQLTNVLDGGNGGSSGSKALIGHPVSAETRKKLSDAQKGRKHSLEARAKLSAAMLNRPPMSDATRAKLKNSLRIAWQTRSKRSPDVETRAKLSAALKGRVRSEEHQAKLTAAAIGRVFSDESRAKMSASHKARKKDGHQ